MAKFFEQLSEAQRAFIGEQKIFFTASAPENGRVNISPKGMDCFRVLSPGRVAYLDFTGSGNETSAHLAQNGRITIMFCAFQSAPLIMRLYGQGHAVRPRDADWVQFRPLFGPAVAGERQLVVVEISSVQTSCGFAVPFFNYAGERGQLVEWAERKGPHGIAEYWAEKNTLSIDGLPTQLLAP